MGYSLTGSVAEKGFFLCFGPDGNNGKSTLLEAVLYMTGDYGAVIDPQTIMKGTTRDVRVAYTSLVGARYVIGSEPEDGGELAMGEVKRLTGNDKITAMYKYKAPFEFKPQLKMWLSTNNRPKIADTTDAAWDRVKIVPFNASYSRDKRDKQLGTKLEAAADAILAWAAQGCRQWVEAGQQLREPDVMRAAHEEYRSDEDPFMRFLRDECEIGTEKRVKGTALLKAYNDWADSQEDHPEQLKQKKLYALAANHGFKNKVPIGGSTHLRGLALRGANTAEQEDERAGSDAPHQSYTPPDDGIPW